MSLLAPVDVRHPEAAPAWRRLLTPLAFFRHVRDEGTVAWLHNVACRPLLEAAALARYTLAITAFHAAVLIAPHSVLASLPVWIFMLVCSVQAFVYTIIWVFLGKKDTPPGHWE